MGQLYVFELRSTPAARTPARHRLPGRQRVMHKCVYRDNIGITACTGCGRCIACPGGINIHDTVKILWEDGKSEYESLLPIGPYRRDHSGDNIGLQDVKTYRLSQTVIDFMPGQFVSVRSG